VKDLKDPLDWSLKDDLDAALANEGARLRMRVDSRRYGKQVTVIEGWDPSVDIQAMATRLKKAMGVGGTAKDNAVELQGDHRRAVREWLEKQGLTVE